MKILRYALCFFIAFFGVYLGGVVNLVNNDISESMAISSFFGVVVLVSLIVYGLLEMYLNFKKKIDDLVWRVEQLEERMKDKGQSP